MVAARPDLIRFFSFASAATCSEDGEPGGGLSAACHEWIYGGGDGGGGTDV